MFTQDSTLLVSAGMRLACEMPMTAEASRLPDTTLHRGWLLCRANSQREQLQQDPHSECLEAHSISSSASVSSKGGTVRPSALATLTLMTSLELSRLPDGEIGGLSTLQDLVHEAGNPVPEGGAAHPVRHQAPRIRELAKRGTWPAGGCWQPRR